MVDASTRTNEAAALPTEAVASFRFVGSDIDPGLISERLNINPSAVFPPPTTSESSLRHGRPNMWRLDSGIPRTKPLAEHLRVLIEVLTPVRAALHRLESEAGWSPCFYCGYFYENDQGGQIVLPPSILRDIADLGATLDLRVYSDADDSD
jgi:hypothetical protein